MAAAAALQALEDGNLESAVGRLADARASELGAKLRFNRWLRWISSSTAAIGVVSVGARLAPSSIRRLVSYAGDAA